jgi:hypothetical protein
VTKQFLSAAISGAVPAACIVLARGIAFAPCIVAMCVIPALHVPVARADPSAAESGDFTTRARDDPDELADSSLAHEPDSKRAALSALDPAEIERLLARYAKEPSALDVARAALKAADSEPDRFASMLRRARWRGLVPSLALGARRGQGVDLRSTVTEDESLRFTTGDDLVLSATLRFELGRLLFADEEVTIARETRAARAARLELIRDVIHWYYLRRRLQLERDALGHTSITRELKIAEIESLLDTFTNGAFGSMIGRHRKTWTIEESTPGLVPK